MDNNYNIFRRAAVGGFNRQDVISYIEKMRNEFYDYKKEVEQTISQLNEKISELEAICQAGEASCEVPADVPMAASEADETDAVSEINEATLRLRMVADDLCKSLCMFMEKVSENAVSVVITDKDERDGFTEEEMDELFADSDIVDEFFDDIDTDESEAAEADAESAQVIAEEPISVSVVDAILAFTDSFRYDAEMEAERPEAAAEKEKGDILDILGSAGFLI